MDQTQQAKPKDVGSAFDLIPKSYELVKKHWKFFLVVNVLGLLSALFALPGPREDEPEFIKAIEAGNFSSVSTEVFAGFFGVVLLFIIIGIILEVANLVLQIKVGSDQKLSFSKIFSQTFSKIFSVIGLMIMNIIIVAIGLVLLIVPGIFAIHRLIMSPYILIDQNTGVFEAMGKSNNLAKTNSGAVWGLLGVLLIIIVIAFVLSVIPLIGALLATLFDIAMAMVIALRYFQLKKA